MLFRTIGLYWKRSDVFWGRPKNPGKLLGRKKSEKRGGVVDFWNQAGVYVLYSNFKIVYVGQAGGKARGLGRRLRHHTMDDLAGRWDTFSWFGMLQVKKNWELAEKPELRASELQNILNMVEGVLIAAAEPPLNRQGGRFGEKVERFLQVRDERLDNQKLV